MKSEYSAGGVVYRHTDKKLQILFILDPYDRWALPKGHIEEGESREEAALREIEEEAGINQDQLRVVKKLGKLRYRFKFNEQKINKLVYFYLVEASGVINIKPQLEEKIKDVKWVDIDKARDILGYKNAEKILNKGIGIMVDNL